MMNNYSKPLADAIKKARGKLGLTQEQVAELANTDSSNIMKMENVKRNANPELATLYPVIRALSIDPQEIFYPELTISKPYFRNLQQLIASCSEQEADALIPIIRQLLTFMRSTNKTDILE